MNTSSQDARFREAVGVIDAGDIASLQRVLSRDPILATERLTEPGAWLCEKAGDALSDFFRDPYLLWFVAEDPVRNGKLPANIAPIAQLIIEAAKRESAESLQHQLDYALRLVCWSWIARECGVQIELIDVLLDAGADLEGRALNEGRFGTNTDAAIYNGNLAAAEHLVQRGAELTLTTALCLNRWADVDRLAGTSTSDDRQNAFVQAAMRGNAEALRRMLSLGVDPSGGSERNQSHATALHHAVWSGSLDAVKVLIEAGASLTRRDTIYGGTPLDWVMHGESSTSNSTEAEKYRQIEAYLRTKETPA